MSQPGTVVQPALHSGWTTVPSSLQTMSQPGTVVQPECNAETPYLTGMVTCTADGIWHSSVMCSDQPGCANAPYDPTVVSVTGVEAITSEHQSCDNFYVAQGSVCHVVCEDGQYAPGSYQVECVGNDEWQIVNSGTCVPNSQSNPPNHPIITSVAYDYDRMMVTVTFDFTNKENDDLVHSWRVQASNLDLGPQNQLNSVINLGFLELSIPATGVAYHVQEICYKVSVENSVGVAASSQYCTVSAPSFAPSISPTTEEPTPTPSVSPSTSPSDVPSRWPTSDQPTSVPSVSPTTVEPTTSPSVSPSVSPSMAPTTEQPTTNPSVSPSMFPTTEQPTIVPSIAPSTTSPSVR